MSIDETVPRKGKSLELTLIGTDAPILEVSQVGTKLLKLTVLHILKFGQLPFEKVIDGLRKSDLDEPTDTARTE